LKKLSIILAAIVVMALLLSGCSKDGGSVLAKKGDTVRVDYTGTLADGSVFDSSKGRQPLQFTIGDGNMIAGFDAAVVGMKVGQTKKVTIPAAQAYGPHRDDYVLEVPRSQMPPTMTPAVGDQLQMQGANGSATNVTVTKVSATSVTVDANPPMAGKDLTFEIMLVEITK
jgi:peptidylprolyl isomerase